MYRHTYIHTWQHGGNQLYKCDEGHGFGCHTCYEQIRKLRWFLVEKLACSIGHTAVAVAVKVAVALALAAQCANNVTRLEWLYLVHIHELRSEL